MVGLPSPAHVSFAGLYDGRERKRRHDLHESNFPSPARSLRRAVGETNVFEFPQRMGAEDFSYYQEVVPGFFLRLGSGNKAKGITAESHTPEFDIDEECLVAGVKVMANLALDFLERKAAEAKLGDRR